MDDELTKVIKVIGSVIFTAILYALPILLTCSFAFSWIQPIKFFLVIINICLFTAICSMIFAKVED